jgi:ribosomal protein S18 acetylase RimI-like enzyme
MDTTAIVPLDRSRIDELRDLWLALHHAHRITAGVALQPDDERSWQLRRSDYREWLGGGTAFAFGAERASQLVGYVLARVHEGENDTFDLGTRHAEVYSLSVAPAERGHGLGGRLLDAVDRELERRGIAKLTIAVMAGNDAARRLYERRGFVAGEILMFRP